MLNTDERLCRKPEVLNRTGYSNSTLYYMISKEKFPKPFKIGERSVAWRWSAIKEWMDNLEEVTFLCDYENKKMNKAEEEIDALIENVRKV